MLLHRESERENTHEVNIHTCTTRARQNPMFRTILTDLTISYPSLSTSYCLSSSFMASMSSSCRCYIKSKERDVREMALSRETNCFLEFWLQRGSPTAIIDKTWGDKESSLCLQNRLTLRLFVDSPLTTFVAANSKHKEDKNNCIVVVVCLMFQGMAMWFSSFCGLENMDALVESAFGARITIWNNVHLKRRTSRVALSKLGIEYRIVYLLRTKAGWVFHQLRRGITHRCYLWFTSVPKSLPMEMLHKWKSHFLDPISHLDI